jgi:uncharacterized protein YjbI with pentapeptide repeats
MRRFEVLRGWRERWNTPEMRPLARQLASELLAGDVRSVSPFGLVDGRVDLRGLQADLLTAKRDPMYQRTGVRGGCWDALDLSGAGLSGMNWLGLRVTDCVLVDAQLDDLRCWGIEVADCVLRRASLRHAQIGAPAEGYGTSTWRRVDLQNADLRQLHGTVVLEDVDLGHAKFARTNLGWSELVRVHFGGVVTGLIIGDLHADQRPPVWPLIDVDLREATIRDLSLVGVNLGTPEVDIKLPDDADHWLIRDWPAFLGRIASRAPFDLRQSADVWVDHHRRALGPQQSWGFTTLRDAREYAGEPFADLLRSSR